MQQHLHNHASNLHVHIYYKVAKQLHMPDMPCYSTHVISSLLCAAFKNNCLRKIHFYEKTKKMSKTIPK